MNLQVQISWQAQYKMRFGEIADARNAVFFNRTGGFKPGKSSSAERRVRDGPGSFSDHARIMVGHGRKRPSIGIRVFTCFLKCRFRGRKKHFVNLHVQISGQVQHFVNVHVQISWQAQHFVNLEAQISALCERPRADFVAGAAHCEPPGADCAPAQHFVELRVQISWQVQHFVNLQVQISWQAQHFVNLHSMCRFRGRCSTL